MASQPSPTQIDALIDNLHALSRNLWWTWNHTAQEVFAQLSPYMWERSNHNPVEVLRWVRREELRLRLRDAHLYGIALESCREFSAYMKPRTTWVTQNAAEFKKLGAEVSVATDDGSRGFRGKVTELVAGEVRRQKAESRRQKVGPVLYACGPLAMLADVARRFPDTETWGFFEERMGCGTGICYCCALKRKSGGYIRFCKEGPVVRLSEVDMGQAE